MKNTIKKTVCALLALIMLFAVVSCVKKEDNDSTDNTTVSTEPESTEIASLVPDDLSFDGMTYTVLCRVGLDYMENEIYLENGENLGALDQALYERMLYVEDKLGVEIAKVDQPDMYKMNARIRTDIETGEPSFDAVAHFVYHAPELALEGKFCNWYDVPYVNESIERSSPWWPESLSTMSTVKDQLYFISGDISISMLKTINVMYMNKQVADEWHIDNVYDLVRNEKWTFEEMEKIVKNVTEDKNGDTVYDENDLYGFASYYFDHYFAEFDIPIVLEEGDDLKLAVYTNRFVDSYDMLYSFFHDNVSVYDPAKLVTDSTTKKIVGDMFKKDQLLFMGHLTSEADKLVDMKSEYTVIPWPMYDENQDGYRTVSHNNYSTFCVPVTLTGEKLEMVGAVTELLAETSYRNVTPLYKEIILKYRYSSDETNMEMLDIVFDSIVFDFGITYSYSIEDIGFLYRNIYKNKENIAHVYGEEETAYRTALANIVNKFSIMEG